MLEGIDPEWLRGESARVLRSKLHERFGAKADALRSAVRAGDVASAAHVEGGMSVIEELIGDLTPERDHG